ncbi:hypothetical protein KP509_27G036300 [Ceratopteris richardii]|nr:hypothetical protein KP509_27G036300 [Ceratopteris richardii]
MKLNFDEEFSKVALRMQRMEAAQVSILTETDSVLRRCTDEITLLRTNEQEKVQAAMSSILKELDEEREARKCAEMDSKSLAIRVNEANKSILLAEKKLDMERKSRKVVEDLCNELSKEMAGDKIKIEELSREVANVRHEMEEERKASSLVEVCRKVRFEMELSEAKLQLKERCLSLDKLKMELESFLDQQRRQSTSHIGKSLRKAIKKREDVSLDVSLKSSFFHENGSAPASENRINPSKLGSSCADEVSKNSRPSLIRHPCNRKTAYPAGCNAEWDGGLHNLKRNLPKASVAQSNEKRSDSHKQESSETYTRSRSNQNKEFREEFGNDSIFIHSRKEASSNDIARQGSRTNKGRLRDHVHSKMNVPRNDIYGAKEGEILSWSTSEQKLGYTRVAEEISHLNGSHTSTCEESLRKRCNLYPRAVSR